MTYPKVVTRPTPISPPAAARSSGRLLGRRALVTATRSPLGTAVAAIFAREGAEVVSVDDAPADAESAARLVDDAASRLGGLDLIVVVPEPARPELAPSPLDRVLQHNIYPLFWMSKAARRYLSPGSAIITTDVVDGTGRRASIAEAKAGIETVTNSLAERFGADGVRVTGVAPSEHGADSDRVAAAYLDVATGTMTGEMLVV